MSHQSKTSGASIAVSAVSQGRIIVAGFCELDHCELDQLFKPQGIGISWAPMFQTANSVRICISNKLSQWFPGPHCEEHTPWFRP